MTDNLLLSSANPVTFYIKLHNGKLLYKKMADFLYTIY